MNPPKLVLIARDEFAKTILSDPLVRIAPAQKRSSSSNRSARMILKAAFARLKPAFKTSENNGPEPSPAKSENPAAPVIETPNIENAQYAALIASQRLRHWLTAGHGR